MFSDILQSKINNNKKLLALLVDPDKHNNQSLTNLINIANTSPSPDIILVGGSIIFKDIHETIGQIKNMTNIPVFIFPGNALQVTAKADGILLLSLISGRNPNFLIGNHVLSAPIIKKHNLKTIPTGYMLINSGASTSVEYMSNTTPIPYNKTDIAVATAIAGEQLGLKTIYLEAGSGASKPVSSAMISAVKQNINIPLIVGGGIKTNENIVDVLNAGSDIIVIGSASEKNPKAIHEFAKTVYNFNK